jgi:hypothetical protein
MFSFSRTITLLAICALGLTLVVPAIANAAPAEEEYVLDLPSAGSNPGGAGDGGGGSAKGDGSNAAEAAVDSADEGGLPILLIVLAGTALAGASIAIMRRQRT